MDELNCTKAKKTPVSYLKLFADNVWYAKTGRKTLPNQS